MHTLRNNIDNIRELIDAGKAGEARRITEDLLAQLPEGSRRERTALFEILLYIELYSDSPLKALKVIERRSAVGYRTFSECFGNSLLAARLLLQTGQWFAARAELTELLRDPKSEKQKSLLEALAVYVKSDERCRREMDAVLRQHLATTVKALGITLSSRDERADVGLAIQRAHGALRASSREYSELVMRRLNAATGSSDAALAREIRERARKEKVGF